MRSKKIIAEYFVDEDVFDQDILAQFPGVLPKGSDLEIQLKYELEKEKLKLKQEEKQEKQN